MKKGFLSAALAGALVFGLVGCQGGGQNSAKDQNTLNFWVPAFAADSKDITDEEFWKEVLKKFEEENQCTVNVQAIPWDSYEEKYLTGTTSNDGPDIGYMYMEMFYDYIEMGALKDIDEYFTQEEKDNYLYYDLGNILGGQYALPFVVGNPRILVANMDILKEAGVEKVPTTWEELEETGKKIKEARPDVMPLVMNWGSGNYGGMNETFWPYFWSAGGEIVDSQGNLTIDSQAGKTAADFIYKLKQEGIVPASANSIEKSEDPLQNGEAAMGIIASGKALKIDNINWDYVPVLQGPKSANTFIAADCLVMFEKCKNKELGARLLKYVTSKEIMEDFHKRISPQPPITKDEIYSGDPRFAQLFENNESFRTLPVFKGASAMYDTLFKNMQSAIAGEMTPEEALQKTTEYYNSNLK